MGKRVRVGDWPRLTRFYGISPRELACTPNVILTVYAEQLDGLLAEEQLMATQTSGYAHFSEKDQDAMMKRLRRRAGWDEHVESIDSSTPAGKAALVGLGIGVKVG